MISRTGSLARIAFAALTAFGCADGGVEQDAGPSAAEQWASARALWHIDRDPAAYSAWTAVDPETPEGREARRLLAEAAPLYRRGIEEVEGGDDGARETLERAVRVAPMDPDLYLPLARAFRAQAEARPDNPHLFIRAAEYYRKFLVLRPRADEAEGAREELARIDPEGTRIFAPPEGSAEASDEPPERAESEPLTLWPLYVAVAALLLALGAVAFMLRRSGRSLSLATLSERRPELHPAIAYLVGSLRHELLKHRIGAVGDAVGALERGSASEAQVDFLRTRLFGGEPLAAAWEGHLAAFERALGPELDLLRDQDFRRAQRAIECIVGLEKRIQNAEPRAHARLAHAHRDLRTLDVSLATMVRALVRTPVDGSLLRSVVDEVRTEYAASLVTLDEVVIRAPEPAPLVEVFRVDLVLILKNVVRNAILAVGDDEPPRRLGLTVETEVEMTGEEAVRVRVLDTCAARFSTADIYARKMDRGLGLVTAALGRYDGAISVEAGDEEWAKSVVVRFFRVYDDDET